MQFFLHGGLSKDVAAALVRHEHKTHEAAEVDGQEGAPEDWQSPREVLAFLAHKQWNLATADSAFIRLLYEQKAEFVGLGAGGGGTGIVLHFLDANDAQGVDRLFERYPRLSVKRMYTVTGSRVKIRQLPGMRV
jgi:hypothetical protein